MRIQVPLDRTDNIPVFVSIHLKALIWFSLAARWMGVAPFASLSLNSFGFCLRDSSRHGMCPSIADLCALRSIVLQRVQNVCSFLDFDFGTIIFLIVELELFYLFVYNSIITTPTTKQQQQQQQQIPNFLPKNKTQIHYFPSE